MLPKIPPMLLLFSTLCVFLQTTASGGLKVGAQPIGVCYGTFANSQPSAQEAVSLVQSVGIESMRFYGPDHNALQALENTDVQVILGVPNDELEYVASSQDNANQWIQGNVRIYPQVKFRYIVVGNGIDPMMDSTTSEFAQFLLPALQNIQTAISASGLHNTIKVTTAFDQTEILHQSLPPSQGEFRVEMLGFIVPIISFLQKNNAPILVNLHPFFDYIHHMPNNPPELGSSSQGKQDVRLQYALFKISKKPVLQDGPLGYTNVFDAMVDSVYSALEKTGASSLDVVVSEIGWPTAAWPEANVTANIQNAATHNNGLINHVRTRGTPKRPQKRIETYIYALFDENLKGYDDESQRHWGIFWNNKQAKYQINFARK
ncbi:Acidic class II 1,3-beta-glucanase [Heracleum sosnowskyi]|uniref:Acidic class II 1,3-beta-glucanase n=1 Tax=Heracleum sosnowskyi TaxID=360622 RepID=A0AAD8HEI2_9APIA|nr:Acidic class II 1,3-beta-glucanase [Heracleum sosnowskyi]